MSWFPQMRSEEQKIIVLNTPPRQTNVGYDDELLALPPPSGGRSSPKRSATFNSDNDSNSGHGRTASPTEIGVNNGENHSVELRHVGTSATEQPVVVATDIPHASQHSQGRWIRSLVPFKSRKSINAKNTVPVRTNVNDAVDEDLSSASGAYCNNNNDIRQNRRTKTCSWCSRNLLVLWAVLATVLLVINMSVTSTLLRRNVMMLSNAKVESCSDGGKKKYVDDTQATSRTDDGTSTITNTSTTSNQTSVSANSTKMTSSGSRCGCATCTDEKWNKPVGFPVSTCGQRVEFLLASNPLRFSTEVDACRQIAQEYPCDCGMCDPGRCSIFPPEFFAPDNWTPKDDYSVPATPAPKNIDQDTTKVLYCYPPAGERLSYTNAWNNYYVEVKDGRENPICGPGNNRFDPANVVFDTTTKTIKLLYKNAAASEVRVLLPNNEKFTYGKYKFEIGSIKVMKSTGEVTSNIFPKELVFGLFTWDDTEDYSIKENYNHEVDIEISRWDCETNSDVQFLVQPPGYPQMQRFFSGGENNKYSQQNQVYEFDWGPGRIDWSSTAGKGQEFSLKTEEALYRNVPDYIQCMPDRGMQTEVRINLWNSAGALQPSSMAADDVVEVEITHFSFTPSTEPLYVADGGFCSKHCQCNYPSSKCEGGICTVAASS